MGSGIKSYLSRRRAVASSRSDRAGIALGAAVRASVETLENRTLLSGGPGGSDDAASFFASISAADVKAAGGNTTTVTVRYQDNAGVDTASIDASDLVVTAPDGSGLSVSNVSVDGTDPTSVVASYVVASPADWSTSSNGQYTVALPAGAVTGSAGSPPAATSGAFNVQNPAPDNTPPVVQIAAADVNSAGANSYTFSVNVTDDQALNLGSLKGDAITVSGPNGKRLSIQSASATPGADGKSAVASVTVAAPHG